MGKRGKRSFDQVEESSIDVYEFSSSERRNLKKSASKRPGFNFKPMNHDLDMNTKIAAVEASPSVVSLVSFSGGVVLTQGCGTIIEASGNNNIVMTSLNLIRQPTKADIVKNNIATDLKIVVCSSDENSYIGEIEIYDFHYNILIIKFKSKTRLQSANLRVMDYDPGLVKSFLLRPHPIKVKVGDPVVVVGRYFYKTLALMAAPGCLRKGRSDYDCRELLLAGCSFTRCGDGAPLVNLSGEVLGLAYYEHGPIISFLPINIAYKLWDHYKIYKELRHPSYGFEASNLYSTSLPTVDRVIRRFPSISGGVWIEKVQPGSYAESAGLCEDDVITTCDGKTVGSFLELWGCMWDKVGDHVELDVVRVSLNTILSIRMVVGEATPDELNKWPRYDYK